MYDCNHFCWMSFLHSFLCQVIFRFFPGPVLYPSPKQQSCKLLILWISLEAEVLKFLFQWFRECTDSAAQRCIDVQFVQCFVQWRFAWKQCAIQWKAFSAVLWDCSAATAALVQIPQSPPTSLAIARGSRTYTTVIILILTIINSSAHHTWSWVFCQKKFHTNVVPFFWKPLAELVSGIFT